MSRRRERRAQLVRQRGQERVLRAVGLLGLLLRLLRLGEQLRALELLAACAGDVLDGEQEHRHAGA